MGDEILRRPREPGARLRVVLHARHSRRAPPAPPRRGLDLAWRDPGHEAQGSEHLHVLFVVRSDLADRLLARVGQVEENTQAEVLAQGEIPPGALGRLAIGVHRPLRHGGGAAPMTPLIRWRTMKSSARGLALTMGCQTSTGRLIGRGTSVISRSS